MSAGFGSEFQKKTTEGSKMFMNVFVLCFVLSVIFFFFGLWFYSNSEDTAYHATLKKLNEVSSKNESLEKILNANISTIATNNLKFQALENLNIKMSEDLKKAQDEMDVFRDQVFDTREKQIKLRDMLSRKRPQFSLPTGVIPIEISINPNPPKSPHGAKPTKDQRATLKKVKSQLDGLSR
jgi:lipopolysaccharide export LptBFGC system permease protein LptF